VTSAERPQQQRQRYECTPLALIVISSCFASAQSSCFLGFRPHRAITRQAQRHTCRGSGPASSRPISGESAVVSHRFSLLLDREGVDVPGKDVPAHFRQVAWCTRTPAFPPPVTCGTGWKATRSGRRAALSTAPFGDGVGAIAPLTDELMPYLLANLRQAWKRPDVSPTAIAEARRCCGRVPGAYCLLMA